MAGDRITKEVAEKALKKLEAREITSAGAAHPRFAIYHREELVAETGLRHSSNKDIPVPHVKRDLRVNARFVRDLAACPKSREDWLRARGFEQQQEPQEQEGVEPQEETSDEA